MYLLLSRYLSHNFHNHDISSPFCKLTVKQALVSWKIWSSNIDIFFRRNPRMSLAILSSFSCYVSISQRLQPLELEQILFEATRSLTFTWRLMAMRAPLPYWSKLLVGDKGEWYLIKASAAIGIRAVLYADSSGGPLRIGNTFSYMV